MDLFRSVEQSCKLVGVGCKLLRAGLLERIAVTKPPQHADARQTGCARRGDVDLRIADIDRARSASAKLRHGGQQRVRRGLAPDAGFLADGDRDRARKKICPQCGNPVEVFSTDTEVVCDKCGFVIYNDMLSCVQWCKYARKCVGDQMYEQMMEIAKHNKEKAAKERAEKAASKEP